MKIFELKKLNGSKEKSLLFKIINVCLYCLLIPSLIFFCTMAISFLVSKSKTGIPMFLNYAVLTVSSGSMVDRGFEVGDQVLVKRVPAETLEVGDFIAFFDYEDPNCSSPESVTASLTPRAKANTSRKIFHEIIEIFTDATGERWFRTKGSNNALPDGNIIYENYVIGQYQKSSQAVNNFLGFLFSLNGAIVFVIVPCGIILCKDSFTLACIIVDIVRRRKKVLKNKFDVVKQSDAQNGELVKKGKQKRRRINISINLFNKKKNEKVDEATKNNFNEATFEETPDYTSPEAFTPTVSIAKESSEENDDEISADPLEENNKDSSNKSSKKSLNNHIDKISKVSVNKDSKSDSNNDSSNNKSD